MRAPVRIRVWRRGPDALIQVEHLREVVASFVMPGVVFEHEVVAIAGAVENIVGGVVLPWQGAAPVIVLRGCVKPFRFAIRRFTKDQT